MFFALIETLLVSLFAVCLVWAAVSDVLTLKIPNACSALIGAAFLTAALSSGLASSVASSVASGPASGLGPAPMGWEAFGWHMLTALGALVTCYVLFAFGTLGAGDGKLVAVIVAWLGPAASVQFAMVACLAGGALALAILMLRNYPLPLALATHPAAVRLQGKPAIPYGLPLALGGLYAIADTRWAQALPFL